MVVISEAEHAALDKLYRKWPQPPGHSIGMAQFDSGFGVGMVVACSCGYASTWEPVEPQSAVMRRWKRHLMEQEP